MKRPSRALLESATTTLKNGRFLAPPRASLITTIWVHPVSEAGDFKPLFRGFASSERPRTGPVSARLSGGRIPAVENLIKKRHDNPGELVFLAFEEMQRFGHNDLVRTLDLHDLLAALVSTNLGDLPVLASEYVEHRDLDAEHLLEAVDDADEDPGPDGLVIGFDQVLIGHGGTQAVRHNRDVLVALRFQIVDR